MISITLTYWQIISFLILVQIFTFETKLRSSLNKLTSLFLVLWCIRISLMRCVTFLLYPVQIYIHIILLFWWTFQCIYHSRCGLTLCRRLQWLNSRLQTIHLNNNLRSFPLFSLNESFSQNKQKPFEFVFVQKNRQELSADWKTKNESNKENLLLRDRKLWDEYLELC